MPMYKPGIEDALFPLSRDLSDAHVLAQAMTLDEQIDMLSGKDDLALRGLPSLGLPDVWCSDATSGVRCFGPAAAFPAGISMAAAWNSDLMYRIGTILAEECRAVGVSILLGPGVNITRVPVCGRNFEYFGEDPFLSGELAVSYIKGLQDHGVTGVVKHLACNNSEYDRHRSNSVVDERTLREIYLPAFEAAVVKGRCRAVMAAYNQVNGTYTSEHPHLLDEILRGEWGFPYLVMSDWNSLYSTQETLEHGVDLEMPKARWLTKRKVRSLLRKGKISEAMITSKVMRILETCRDTGAYHRRVKDPNAKVLTQEHISEALNASREGIVLLKNKDALLPVKQGAGIVLMGCCAADTPTGGGGSSFMRVDPSHPHLEEALRNAGLLVTYFKGTVIQDKDKQKLKEADYIVIATGFNRIWESEAYDRPYDLPNQEAKLILDAAKLNSSLIVLLHGGGDMETKSWIDAAPAVLFAGYLGMHRGTAPADIITGKAVPSGKLPFTMAKRLQDHPAMRTYYKKPWNMSFLRVFGPQGRPGFRKTSDLHYEEGIMVGYRHFDTNQVEPVFPFGHGLSYTSFAYNHLMVSPMEIGWEDFTKAGTSIDGGPVVQVSCSVRNTGNIAGAEVLQLYIHDETSFIMRPEQELKGFCKVFLEAGSEQRVTINLPARAFMYYDEKRETWKAEPGFYEVRIGSSSRDIRLKTKVHLQEEP